MAWLSVSLEVPAERAETLSDALLQAGAASVDIAAAGTPEQTAAFADAGTVPRTWKRSVVSALVAQGVDITRLVESGCACAGLSALPWRVDEVAEKDWVHATREQLVPVRISPRLWIVPSWHDAPEPDAINIVLDPGLAFGTGHHPTTRMCLRWLERVLRGGESVLDFGCGSGILAIAAMKFGAACADGVDIDEQALLAARRNALQNRVQATFHGAAEAQRQPSRIVVANILAHPLVVLAPLLARLTARSGRIALAGLLMEQAEEVRAAYASWFDFEAIEEDEGWALVSGVRR